MKLLSSILFCAALGAAIGTADADDLGIFVDRAEEMGIDFEHFAGVSGEYYIPEISGPGCGLLDYDNDGDLDVYLIQSAMLGPGKKPEEATFPPQEGYPLRDRLYRNDLVIHEDDTRTVRFTDVTEESGIRAPGYGVGIATGDYDNDGWVDIFLTNFGANQLWHNNGDGTFEEVIAQAGIDDPRWNTGATWVDIDRDGWLDLFVGCYLDFNYTNHQICRSSSGVKDYCAPQTYSAVNNRLYRNNGDGTFDDWTNRSKIGKGVSKTLGVNASDLNHDGWMDIYAANDAIPNHMWINQQDGTFVEDSLFGGTAVNSDGFSESSMGVDAADFDDDGDEDLFMTHLGTQTNTLFVNDGTGLFEDRTAICGLGAPSIGRTSWGTRFFDYDNDGLLDIMTVSGEVFIIEALAREGDPFPMHQKNQLFRNLGKGKYTEVTESAGSVFELSEVSRGLAFGDIDNDGDTDVLLANCQGRARLLLNTIGNRNHWLGLRFVDGEPERDLLGTWIGVHRKDRPTKWRRVRADGGFATANDTRLIVGLGSHADVESIEVHWPDGSQETFRGVIADRYNTMSKGGSTPPPKENEKP